VIAQRNPDPVGMVMIGDDKWMRSNCSMPHVPPFAAPTLHVPNIDTSLRVGETSSTSIAGNDASTQLLPNDLLQVTNMLRTQYI
jgi:hypothetical protein